MQREEAVKRLSAATLPKGVHYVIETLQKHGHQAVLVGGCVRDCILDRPLQDWDLATSARPEEVQGVFRKTIPTGIEHGTVTVLPPVGPKTPVEVTTFRGDEDYVDGRHPSSVCFLTNLDEDLARRDFTINAMAYDPIGECFSDPFGGLEDLASRRVRAVGTALNRFREDGLRTMRALRFAACLDFSLEAQTARALAPCVDVLAKVSRERVRVELSKMLKAPDPGESLRWMWSSGIWEVVLGAASRPSCRASLDALLASVAALPNTPWVLRLTGLLSRIRRDAKACNAVVESLRPSREEKKAVAAWTSPAALALEAQDLRAYDLRRIRAELGPERIPGALALAGWTRARRQGFEACIQGAPSSVAELDISAKDLLEASIVEAGPQLGLCLRSLLDWVLEDPSRNREALLKEKARAILEAKA